MSNEPSSGSTTNSENQGPKYPNSDIMDSIIKDSSSKNSDFFTAYLALLTYVLATVFATTDLQLLSSSEGINLPIAGINVPVAGFYIVMPLFVVALHFNFLQNLDSHHYKLMCWIKSHTTSQIHRSQIQVFLFDYAELEEGSRFDSLVRMINGLLCLYFAPITLCMLLWRFTDRQEAWITIWQIALLGFDWWLICEFMKSLEENRQKFIPTQDKNNSPFFKYFLTLCISLVCIFIGLETLLTIGVAWLPSKLYITHINSRADDFRTNHPRMGSLLLPYISINSNETVWKPDNNYFETRAKLEGEMDLEMFFKRQGQGFKPSTPNLRLVNLRGQYIPNAELKGVKLEGAILESAQLQGAHFEDAQLQAVSLKGAELQGAHLSKAQLQDARLQEANLQGADLTAAQLQYANLSNTQLQGALLYGTDLQVAKLDGAQLQGALLFETHLLAAELNGADLQGAILHNAELTVNSEPKKAKVFRIEPAMNFTQHPQDIENFMNNLALAPKSRDSFQGRIDTFLKRKIDYKESNFPLKDGYNNDATDVIRKLCKDGSRSEAIQGIYNNYYDLTKDYLPLLRDSALFENVKKRNPLGSIRDELCNDRVCDNLKNKIDKLDCSLDPETGNSGAALSSDSLIPA